MARFQLGDNVFADITMASINTYYGSVSGIGDMWEDASDFISLDGLTTWNRVQGRISGTLNISDGITSIANNFLNANDFLGSLKIVNIGKDITRIGNYAFGSIQLTDLIEINIHPEAVVESLGDYCFRGLKNLETLYFNGTVTSVGEGCFYNCQKLVDIGLSKKVEKFYPYTFYNCYNLKTFNYKNCVNDLDPKAFTNRCFRECRSLTEITFKYGVAFPTSGGTDFMYVSDNTGVDCDTDGNLKTLIWTNNPQVSERDWLGLDNRNVTIKRIPSCLAVKHESKIYDLHYFDQ